MAKLLSSGIVSLDGYTADRDGMFDWSAPDEEVHRFVNDLERRTGTALYGRRVYEVMSVWENDDILEGEPAVMRDYATIWRATDKIVYSSTLQSVSTGRTRIEREFDPAAIARLKQTEERDISIGGPHLAAQAIRAGLVDEFHLFVTPVLVGGGTPFFPPDIRINLTLIGENRFVGGVVHLHYRALP
ncbi:dihydrofolate reductase family protein [Glaciihabitans sp. dw_435]|uniref:dihydrofolate reductase family protein n=1 Tax=Glaciihabitans sp. dw_435 TaxID=2720081 RepID=UPI001BD57991|nr:dihydrofolate reductase family protein [Glaciihabitans sp. dw_435]